MLPIGRILSATRRVAPSLIALGVVLAATSFQLLRSTEGHLVYALDDAYIHMAMAKNIVQHGVWGVNADEFAFASSSPLWTGLLAVSFAVAGVRDWVPLALNIAFASAVVGVTSNHLRRESVPDAEALLVVVMVILYAPLAPLVWSGMEHSLHILLTLLTVWTVSRLTSDYSVRGLARACILGSLLVATRYEGLFVVAGCALVLLLHRRSSAAVALSTAGALPVVVFGVWSISKGWFFLPASILMKQTVLQPEGSAVSAAFRNVIHSDAPAAFFVLAVAAALLVAAVRPAPGTPARCRAELLIFLVAAILHLLLARFGWLYRYESYLMALGTCTVSVAFLRWAQGEIHRTVPLVPRWGVFAAAVFAVLVGAERTLASPRETAKTAGRIYRQQWQMARFIHRYHDGEAVALNDIGAVSYFTRARVHDLLGLASLEAAEMRRSARWDAHSMGTWLERDGVKIAVVYDKLFSPPFDFQREWIRVGTWADDREPGLVPGTVTFFARDTDTARLLLEQLRAFVLPPEVVVTLDLAEPPTGDRLGER